MDKQLKLTFSNADRKWPFFQNTSAAALNCTWASKRTKIELNLKTSEPAQELSGLNSPKNLDIKRDKVAFFLKPDARENLEDQKYELEEQLNRVQRDLQLR